MHRAIIFRIYPTKEQMVFFSKSFGCTRFIYNKMLGDKITHYEQTKESLRTTPAQYKDEFPWLKDVDSLALANTQLDLEQAYKNFFKQPKAGFPKFKKKSSARDSYTTNSQITKSGKATIKLIESKLYVPKLKSGIKIKLHRDIPNDFVIKSVTISRDKTDAFYASVLFYFDRDVPLIDQRNIKEDRVVGLDFMMNGLFMCDTGFECNYPRYYRTNEAKLAKAQRKLSKKAKGSKNRAKAKLKVARAHKKTANQRKDFLHKMSREITNSYDAVCVENLNMHGMAQALNFGKSVHDNGWGMFTAFLQYKLASEGKHFVEVGKWFPSTQTCSNCKAKTPMPLKEKTYNCSCGLVLARDLNAAINIKQEGLRILWGKTIQ